MIIVPGVVRRTVQLLGAALLVAALVPVSASASVRIDARAVTVGGAGGAGSLVVERSPLRIAVRDARGRTVLRSVAGARTVGGVPYAPLALSIGEEPELRVPVLAGEEDPNPANPAAPRRARATRIVRAARAGAGARLTLATDEPSGRRITMTVAPGRDGTFALAARADGVSSLSAAFAAPPGEAFHGFGGRREATNLRGRAFTGWVLDYRFPNPSTSYYDVQQAFLSSRGYGAILEQPELARWRMASDTSAWRVAVRGGDLRLVLAAGTAAQVVGRLTARTGRMPIAPAWSMGATLSRTIRVGEDTKPGVYEAHVRDDVERLVRGARPEVRAYAFEGWARLPRAFVREQIRRLRAKGIRAILYLRSFTSNDIAGTEPAGSFERAVADGLVARRADGSPYLVPSPFPGAQAAVLDFTRAATRSAWRRQVTELLDTGAEGFMCDFGEQVVPAMRFADGTTGERVHNAYPALQMRVTRAAVRAWERRHRGRDVYVFARAGSRGSYDSVDAMFPGDETVDWTRGTGLPSVVPDMLNRAVGGGYGFTMDIGGYSDYDFARGAAQLTAELFVRWSQAAVFTTHFRVHNSQLFGVKFPWSFDAATERRWAAAARLHARTIPLLRRAWRAALVSGVPPTRPLWLALPSAAGSPRANDEWLVGEDLLAAPVLVEGAARRPVLLPPGCWRREGRGPRLAGGRTVTAPAPLDALPWFARCGTHPLG